MSRAYYNENDPRAASWLRELIGAGLIAAGDVDDRSICDVSAEDVRGYRQCHFFAGIGGWSYALRLAGWSDEREAWTGSCPCQPFSVAGKHRAAEDERHLWPEFYRLISECRPATVFGEQVSSELGLQWLAGVFADLEGSGYAVAGADLCAAGVGAPHIRQRLYWVGHFCGQRLEAGTGIGESGYEGRTRGTGSTGGLADLSDGGLGIDRRAQGVSGHPDERGEVGGMADTGHCPGRPHEPGRGEERRTADRRADAWSSFYLVPCGDGQTRRIGAGIQPLVDGFPERVGLLRGYGNAIVPQVAAAFIEACCDNELRASGKVEGDDG